ncbi:hypothetical protein [Pseudobacteriovorax antillogorgiicola]|uniref:Uncharacterized protein n=1 Tax=Pseudobacteriovorax antillogorgiicola TaxID=1513793 RepID=A0A1Y6BDV6_9BACT|nr:hypothetical protein [Pseudobacteriovorax antillogorgiicola]TCS56374.1 hypothetical protein EDD56_104196 [Pseudobacteriovorax antillogorgiicola]SMF06544.1 hypothetical protein SAMN06296036_104137 [Pseudobacteriovorax antillogorgiicola]
MTKNRFSLLIVTFLAWGLSISCDDPGEDGEGQGGSDGGSSSDLTFGQASIQSSTLAISSLQSDETDLDDCSFSLDIYRGEGACMTPTSVIGMSTLVVGASVDSSGSNSAEARLAATVNFHSDEQDGKIIEGKEFSFSDTSSFKAYNELWAEYDVQASYTHLTMELAYEKIQFEVNSKFVTMFLANYQQPFSEWDILDDCGLSEEEKTYSNITEADVLEGMTFQRGDYLFCVKDTADAECAATDFQWYDLDSDTLVSTRPSNPRTHAFLVFDEATCTDDNGRPSFNMSAIRIGATLNEQFKLYADFSNGVDSVQWKDSAVAFEDAADNSQDEQDNFQEPFLYYYYEDAAGNTSAGTGLDMSFDFNSEDMIYFDGLRASDVEAASIEEVLKVAYARHDWLFHKKGQDQVVGFDVDEYASMTVSATITVSGGQEAPEDTEDE